MAVVGVAELMRKPETVELSDNKITAKAFFRVITDDPGDIYTTVLAATGIPYLFEPFSDELFFCLAVKCIPTRLSAQIWQVEVYYEKRQDAKTEQNPLTLPPKVSIGTESIQMPAMGEFSGGDFTYTGSLTNSAGEIYNPPFLIRWNNAKMGITRNENVYSTDVMSLKNTYENTTNSDTFWGWDAGSAMIDNIGSDIQFATVGTTQVPYLAMKYDISFNQLGFHAQLLDQGTFYLDADSNKITFLTADGQPTIGLLDGTDGKKASDPSDPAFLDKQVYPQTDWSSLSLPTSYLDCLPST